MTFKKLIIGLLVTFGLPWVVLIVGSYGSMAGLKPVPYSEEAGDEAKGFFPPARVGSETRGARIYVEQGCIQCHTQVIRPQNLIGAGDGDEFKKGWGSEQKSDSPAYTRTTTAYDYIGEAFAPIGLRRNGPDLSNLGYRLTADQLFHHLYNPQARYQWSTCPPQPQLFVTRSGAVQPAENALKLSGANTPADGSEVVPSETAKALVQYLLSLKRNYPLPIAVGGPKPSKSEPAKAAAPAAAPAAK